MFLGLVFGAIAGALSTAAGVISTALVTATTALTSLAATASGFLGTIATKAMAFMKTLGALQTGPLGPVLGPIVQQLAINAIVKGITALAKKLGIIEEDEQPAEVGYRMDEAEKHDDWKKREDFKTFEEYNAYLKGKIPDEEIDYRKLKENQEYYKALGTSALTEGIGDHVGIKLTPEFLDEIGRACMEYEEIAAIVDTFKELGYSTVSISDYLKGTLSKDESRKIEDALLANMQKHYPEKDKDALQERLGDMRSASRDDTFLAKEIYKDKLTDEHFEQISKENKVSEDV